MILIKWSLYSNGAKKKYLFLLFNENLGWEEELLLELKNIFFFLKKKKKKKNLFVYPQDQGALLFIYFFFFSLRGTIEWISDIENWLINVPWFLRPKEKKNHLVFPFSYTKHGEQGEHQKRMV